jgi:hypothetical protein
MVNLNYSNELNMKVFTVHRNKSVPIQNVMSTLCDFAVPIKNFPPFTCSITTRFLHVHSCLELDGDRDEPRRS